MNNGFIDWGQTFKLFIMQPQPTNRSNVGWNFVHNSSLIIDSNILPEKKNEN